MTARFLFLPILLLAIVSGSWAACPEGTTQTYQGCKPDQPSKSSAPGKSVQLPDDVASGFTGEGFKQKLPYDFKPWGYTVVSQYDGAPVRAGDQSVRFEVRKGDCGYSQPENPDEDDCNNGRQRHELNQADMDHHGDELWYTWSLFIPESFPTLRHFPTGKSDVDMFGQFNHVPCPPNCGYFFRMSHKKGKWNMKLHTNTDLYVDASGALRDEARMDWVQLSLYLSEMRGKWTDYLVHAKWSRKKNGFFVLYINGRKEYERRKINTISQHTESVSFTIGIYQNYKNSDGSFIFGKETPSIDETQIVYYDEVRRSKNCEGLMLDRLGYSCSSFD